MFLKLYIHKSSKVLLNSQSCLQVVMSLSATKKRFQNGNNFKAYVYTIQLTKCKGLGVFAPLIYEIASLKKIKIHLNPGGYWLFPRRTSGERI